MLSLIVAMFTRQRQASKKVIKLSRYVERLFAVVTVKNSPGALCKRLPLPFSALGLGGTAVNEAGVDNGVAFVGLAVRLTVGDATGTVERDQTATTPTATEMQAKATKTVHERESLSSLSSFFGMFRAPINRMTSGGNTSSRCNGDNAGNRRHRR